MVVKVNEGIKIQLLFMCLSHVINVFFFPPKVCHYLTKFGKKNCFSSVDSTNYDILKEKIQYNYSSHELEKITLHVICTCTSIFSSMKL
jgi:hypothetical protein